jgi:hypothetical protein
MPSGGKGWSRAPARGDSGVSGNVNDTQAVHYFPVSRSIHRHKKKAPLPTVNRKLKSRETLKFSAPERRARKKSKNAIFRNKPRKRAALLRGSKSA